MDSHCFFEKKNGFQKKTKKKTKITEILLSEWCGDEITSFHGFTIRYAETSDRSLSKHMDESEITLNLCLKNDDILESKVFFQNIRDNDNNDKKEKSDNEDIAVQLLEGQALLHVGQHWHGANTLQKGERINWILWLRSQRCRKSAVESSLDDNCHITQTNEKHDEL